MNANPTLVPTLDASDTDDPERVGGPSDRGATASTAKGSRSGGRGRAKRSNPPPSDKLEKIDGPDARIAEILQSITERIRTRPVTSAVAAVGIGFIVGGALSFRLGRMALSAAARHLGRELLKQVL